jgi:hypothetical protein
MTGQRSQENGQVISLVCARYEDTLAERKTEALAHPHLEECPHCAELAQDIMGGEGFISTLVQATGPVNLPDGFLEAVLRKARLPEQKTTVRNGNGVSWMHFCASGLMAGAVAALVLMVMADRSDPRPEPQNAPQAVTVSKEKVEIPAARIVTPSVIPAPQDIPESRPAAPTVNPTKHVVNPVVAPLQKVPEKQVKLPSALRTNILRHVKAQSDCPKHSKTPIRVTLSIGTDGALSNRQVLSSAGQSQAHDCVNVALDKLLLPPMKRGMTVTVDLAW